jgi:hypothetical protein
MSLVEEMLCDSKGQTNFLLRQAGELIPPRRLCGNSTGGCQVARIPISGRILAIYSLTFAPNSGRWQIAQEESSKVAHDPWNPYTIQAAIRLRSGVLR